MSASMESPSSISSMEPPSWRSREKSRVCYVCKCSPEGSSDYYRIYIDPHSTRGLDMKPTLRISRKFFPLTRFSIFGSKLFMFHLNDDSCRGRRVQTFELPSHSVQDYEVKPWDVHEAPPLNHLKVGLNSVITPDAKKLLVFSTNICNLSYGKSCNDFELYDPDVGSWILLPGISPHWRRNQDIHLEAHCILKNILLFQTNIGFFVLDMDNPNQMMKSIPYDVPIPSPPRVHGFGFFIAIGSHDMYLTPYVARDIGRDVCFEYPEWTFPEGDYTRTDWNITLMHHVEGQDCVFCISRSEFSSTTLHPYLNVNLYRLDLVKYSKKMEKMKKDEDAFVKRRWIQKKTEILPGTQLLKSSRFRLSKESIDDYFRSVALFSIY